MLIYETENQELIKTKSWVCDSSEIWSLKGKRIDGS
jgi:hypothetical protein